MQEVMILAKKKKRLKWDRVFLAIVIVIAFVFGIYKSCTFIVDKVGSIFEKEKDIEKKEEKVYIATVVIDPGHGGWDAGANKNELYEKDITLKTAQYIQQELDKKNIKAVLTRTKDEALADNKNDDLLKRAQASQKNNAKYFVSIHVNDYENSTDITGFEVFNKDSNSESLAKMISTQMEELNLTENRGIQDGSKLIVLKKNTVPSVLIEMGYINSSDRNYLSDDSQLNCIAQAIAQGIYNEVEKSYKE